MRVGTSEIKLRAAFRITGFTKKVDTEGGETGCGVIHGGMKPFGTGWRWRSTLPTRAERGVES
jgi:hypothetical protein